jgi:hypothetical protein
MKFNQLKSLAAGLALSALSSAALAASATITPINDAPRPSGSFGGIMSVSDQGTVAIMTTRADAQASIVVNTWSKSSGLTTLGITGTPSIDGLGAGPNSIMISLNGSRVALLNGSTSIIWGTKDRHTYVYTNGVEQVISGSAFAAYIMSGDGKTLGGVDAGKQPAIMDIDTGVITRIDIANVNETNFVVKGLSDDGKTLLIQSTYYFYLVDRAGNVKSRLNVSNTTTTATPETTRNFMDISGDGNTLLFHVGNSCTYSQGECIPILSWTKETGFVQITKVFETGVYPGPKFYINRSGTISTMRTNIWDNVAGKRNIYNALQAKGVDMSGWGALDLTNISSNGKYLVGTGTTSTGEYKRFLIENNTEPVCTTPTF